MREDGRQHFALKAWWCRPGRNRDRYRESLEPIENVGEPPERGGIGPVGIATASNSGLSPARLAASQ